MLLFILKPLFIILLSFFFGFSQWTLINIQHCIKQPSTIDQSHMKNKKKNSGSPAKQYSRSANTTSNRIKWTGIHQIFYESSNCWRNENTSTGNVKTYINKYICMYVRECACARVCQCECVKREKNMIGLFASQSLTDGYIQQHYSRWDLVTDWSTATSGKGLQPAGRVAVLTPSERWSRGALAWSSCLPTVVSYRGRFYLFINIKFSFSLSLFFSLFLSILFQGFRLFDWTVDNCWIGWVFFF